MTQSTSPVRPSSYAQTNLQLYEQLSGLGYPVSTLVLVRRSYELAIQLFSCRYRSNGKPFLAHLVGTASILAAHRASPEVVAAGLLHAAFAQGQFGDTRIGVTPERRNLLRDQVGEAVVQRVADYTEFPWSPDSIARLQATGKQLEPATADLILMRLANELEDYLDNGMSYCRKPSETASLPEPEGAATVALAHKIGYSGLAEELAEAYAAAVRARVPEELQMNHRRSFSVRPRLPGPVTRQIIRLRKLRRRLTRR